MKKVFFIMLASLVTLQLAAQTSTDPKKVKGVKGSSETVITLGARLQYFIPTNTQNTGTSPFLFLKNAQAVGLELSFAPGKTTTRLKLSADYIFGTNDESKIAPFAKAQDITYTKTSFTKANPSGLSIMAGPQFMLFPKSTNKNLPLMWLDFSVGALFSNQQTLQFFNGQTIPSKEIASNAVSFVYNPTFVVNVIKTNKTFINASAGYSNIGGITFGLRIAMRDCRNAPCFRCNGVGCKP